MDNNSKIGEMLERGQSLVTNQVKQVVKTAQQQVIGNQQSQSALDAGKAMGTVDAAQSPLGPGIEQATVKQAASQAGTSNKSVNPLQQIIGKQQNTPAELSQMDAVRKLLLEQHKSTYYNSTFNAPKRQEEPVADKLEREKQEDLWKKQQDDAKKPEPIAVTRGKMRNELNRGASG